MLTKVSIRLLAPALALLLAAALSPAACTLIVDAKLNNSDAGARFDAGTPPACDDQGFDDNSLSDGGAIARIDSGVGGAVAFHGRAYLDPSDPSAPFVPTAAAFVSDAGVVAVVAWEYLGNRPFYSLVGPPLDTAVALYLTAGHLSTTSTGSPCFEMLATAVDTVHDKAMVQLWVPNACSNVGDLLVDAGVVTPRQRAQDTGIGWAPLADGGAVLGLQVGGTAQQCSELGGLQDCGAPAVSPDGGARTLDVLSLPSGEGVWATSGSSFGTILQPLDFAGQKALGVPGGAVVPLAPDIAVSLGLQGSKVHAQAFDSAGTLVGAAAQFDLQDNGVPDPTTLAATTYGTPIVRVAWVGTDGYGRVLDIDANDPLKMDAGSPRLVCGSRVRFVAPMSSRWVVVAVGERLEVRPAP